MRIIGTDILDHAMKQYTEAKDALLTWRDHIKDVSWKKPIDVKQDYNSASILRDKRVVFNIKGNKYRIIVKINYMVGIVEIRHICTHDEYNKIDANTI